MGGSGGGGGGGSYSYDKVDKSPPLFAWGYKKFKVNYIVLNCYYTLNKFNYVAYMIYLIMVVFEHL